MKRIAITTALYVPFISSFAVLNYCHYAIKPPRDETGTGEGLKGLDMGWGEKGKRGEREERRGGRATRAKERRQANEYIVGSQP